MSLKDDILDMPVNNPLHEVMTDHERVAYSLGHRDARHAAANMASDADMKITMLRDALLALRDDGAWISGEWVPSEEAQSMADLALREVTQ